MKIPTATRRSQSTSGGRAGFTLVEIMVALIVLTIGVLGLAATTMFTIRQTTLSELTTKRAAALQTVIEELRSVDYDSVRSGSDSVGSFKVSWSVTDGSRSKAVEFVTLGPGLRATGGQPGIGPSVADTFVYRIIQP